MFDHVEGDLVYKSPAEAVIAAGGVGYRFTIPVSTFDALPSDGRVRLLAYLHVREDCLKLYGFATEDERRLFSRLVAIQGIGPGTAIAVLNGMSVDEFRRAVAEEQRSAIWRIKGIGRKTAERIILELKTEMEREISERAPGRRAGVPASDAVSAMLVLGFKRSQSEAAVERAIEALGRDAPLEQIIRQALKQA